MADKENKKNKVRGIEFFTGILTTALAVIGLVLFILSYTTNYYTFGQMNSTMILAMILAGIAIEVFTMYALKKFPEQLWTRFLTFAVTALLAAAAFLLVGDRVEGIGNCIVTNYDSGHGGEEAIYFSMAGAAVMLIGMIINIAGSFSKGPRGSK